MEEIKQLDTQLFLFLNSKYNMFFDPIMYWFSDKWVWIPMYILIAFLIVRHYKMQGVVILIFIGILITICDQTASTLIKETILYQMIK